MEDEVEEEESNQEEEREDSSSDDPISVDGDSSSSRPNNTNSTSSSEGGEEEEEEEEDEEEEEESTTEGTTTRASEVTFAAVAAASAAAAAAGGAAAASASQAEAEAAQEVSSEDQELNSVRNMSESGTGTGGSSMSGGSEYGEEGETIGSDTGTDESGGTSSSGSSDSSMQLLEVSDWQRTLPPDMLMTDEERTWAWRIKKHVESSSNDLEAMSDFRYAQIGMICRGNVEEATRRILGLKEFLDLYHVEDTVEEGMTVLLDFIRRYQPGVLIHADVYNNKTGPGSSGAEEPLAVFNQGKCLPSVAMESEESFRSHILTMYYLFQLLQPSLHCIRQGIIYFVEGKDMTWMNFNQDFQQRLHDELWEHYPMKINQIKVYNSNSVVNIAWNLLKPMMKPEVQNRLLLGCQLELDDRLALQYMLDHLLALPPKLSLCDLFFMPNYETSMRTMEERARRLLTKRYENEESFKLS